MLLNSLFCIHGKDSGLRTLAILSASYFFSFIWMALFGLNASIAIPALLAIPVIGLTGLRRVRDAEKPLWWSYGLIIGWCIWSVTIYLSQSWSISLIIGGGILLLSALIALPISQGKGRYQQGYQGPVTASLASNRPNRRVEPSLDGVSDPSFAEDMAVEYETETTKHSEQSVHTSLFERLPLTRQQSLFAVMAFIALVLLVLLLTFFFSSSSDEKQQVVEQSNVSVPVVQRSTVAFKDGFNLSLEGDKLFMSWKGDEGEPQVLWSLMDAKGDDSCKELRFNNGSKYRPITVKLLGDTSTEALFSPLDTASIIKDIALRGKASLCGYSFSLKGTQAVLSKNKQFRSYIE